MRKEVFGQPQVLLRCCVLVTAPFLLLLLSTFAIQPDNFLPHTGRMAGI